MNRERQKKITELKKQIHQECMEIEEAAKADIAEIREDARRKKAVLQRRVTQLRRKMEKEDAVERAIEQATASGARWGISGGVRHLVRGKRAGANYEYYTACGKRYYRSIVASYASEAIVCKDCLRVAKVKGWREAWQDKTEGIPDYLWDWHVEELDDISDWAVAKRAIGAMGERCQRVIKMRWGLEGQPRSLLEIASEIGVSTSRAWQIYQNVLKQLSKTLEV